MSDLRTVIGARPSIDPSKIYDRVRRVCVSRRSRGRPFRIGESRSSVWGPIIGYCLGMMEIIARVGRAGNDHQSRAPTMASASAATASTSTIAAVPAQPAR